MRAFFIASDRHRDDGDGKPGDTPEDASTLGVKLFLCSLAMLFGASMIGYLVTRLNTAEWDGYKIPGLTIGLLFSTVMLLGTSGALHAGISAIRRDDPGQLNRMLLLTWVLSLAFLVSQAFNWVQLAEHQKSLAEHNLSVALFYMVTALHAFHVIGGFVPLAICTYKTTRGLYSSTRYRGLWNCALYWHFLDAVWIVIAIALFIG